jgi:hypothetical protein
MYIIYYIREGLSTPVCLTLLYWFADFSSNCDSSMGVGRKSDGGGGGGAQARFFWFIIKKIGFRASDGRVAKTHHCCMRYSVILINLISG